MISRDYQNNWTNDGRRPSFVLFLNQMIYIRQSSLIQKKMDALPIRAIDDCARDGGKELFYQDVLLSLIEFL